MGGLDKGACLRFYKKKEIQNAIVDYAKDKEIGIRYGNSFGKRPDILMYPREIIELALRGVTSFHCSEELWEEPLNLSSDMSRKELDELRSGWDLILDIDCPDWEFSKITAYLFIKSLKDNGVKDVSCKFSGNKGFHIGVPFEAFPSEVAGKKTDSLFPEGPKKISQYLLYSIVNNYIKIENNHIIFDNQYSFTLNQFKEKFPEQDFLINKCTECKQEIHLKEKEEKNEFVCPKCEQRLKTDKEFIKCDKCKVLMQKFEGKVALCKCGSNKYNSTFNPLSVIEVDTILISSRHMYRMPYSLHEKSGLASLPIDPDNVMGFEKEMAHPDKIVIPPFKFMERNISGDSARKLLMQALDFKFKIDSEERELPTDYEEIKIESPIKEEFFPPCIKLLLHGIEDGKKRAVFILTNFLGKIGWNRKDIEAYLLTWNRKNKKTLRDNYIKGQLRYFKAGEKLPPNCINEAYYKDLGVCKPDQLCSRIKNSVNYTIIKWRRHLRDKEEEEKRELKAERKKVREEKKLEKEKKFKSENSSENNQN